MLMHLGLVNEVKVDAHCCYRELQKQEKKNATQAAAQCFELILEDTINVGIYHDNI